MQLCRIVNIFHIRWSTFLKFTVNQLLPIFSPAELLQRYQPWRNVHQVFEICAKMLLNVACLWLKVCMHLKCMSGSMYFYVCVCVCVCAVYNLTRDYTSFPELMSKSNRSGGGLTAERASRGRNYEQQWGVKAERGRMFAGGETKMTDYSVRVRPCGSPCFFFFFFWLLEQLTDDSNSCWGTAAP